MSERSGRLTSRWKAFGAPGGGSCFIDHLVASVVGGKERMVDGEEGGTEGTPATDRLSDHTGRHFAEGVPLQPPT